MSSASARRAITAIVAVVAAHGIVLAGLVAPAQAAQPEPGSYRFSIPHPTTPGAISDGIFFSVRDFRDELLVSDFSWISAACGRMQVADKLEVTKAGKFTYKGKATRAGATSVTVKVKGKFTSSSKAKVTVKDKDPGVACNPLKKVKVKKG